MTFEEAMAELKAPPNQQPNPLEDAINTLKAAPAPVASPQATAPEESNPADSSVIQNIAGGLYEGVTTDTLLSSAHTALKSTDTFGDLLGSAKDYGVDQYDWDKMTGEERRVLITEKKREDAHKAFPGSDPEALSYKISRGLGSVVDPTSLIPFTGAAKLATGARAVLAGGPEAAAGLRMAAKGLFTMSGIGSAVGAVDAAMFTLANEGKVNPSTVAMGAGIGAVAPGVVMGAAKGAGKVLQSTKSIINAKGEAKVMVDALSEQVAIGQKAGLNRIDAMERALKELKVDANTAQKSVKKAQAPVKTFDNIEEAGSFLMERAKGESPKVAVGKFSKAMQGVNQLAERIVTPIDARLRQLSPTIYGAVMKAEQSGMQMHHRWSAAVEPHLQDIKLLKKKGVYAEFKKMALTGGDESTTVIPFLRQHLGEDAVANHKLFRDTNDEMYAVANSVRGEKHQMKYTKGHYPRWVVDPEQMRQTVAVKYGKEYLDDMDRFIVAKESGLKGGLSPDQKGKIIADYISNLYTPGARKGLASAKARTVIKVDDELAAQYQDIEQSVHTHIRNVVEDFGRRNVLGKKIADKHGDAYEEGVIEWLDAKVANKELTYPQMNELRDVLKARYINGVRGANDAQRWYKAAQHTTLLGQYTSSITQLEDLSRSVYKNGLANTVKSMFQGKTGRIDPKQEGFIDHLAEEYVTSGLSKRITDAAFTGSGFKMIDLYSKRVTMNAAIKKAASQSLTTKGSIELQSKWLPILGDAKFSKVLGDLEKFHKGTLKVPTEDMKLMAFIDLAELQPTTLMGMPQAYLDHPNGRIFYLLKSFTIKQIDLMRRDIFREYAKGNYGTATKNAMNMAALFTAAGMAKEQVVSMMQGKDTDAEEMFWKNLVRATGVFDKYTLDKIMGGQQDPATSLATGILPPLGMAVDVGKEAAKVVKDVATEDDVDYKPEVFLRYLPLVGNLLSNWMKDD